MVKHATKHISAWKCKKISNLRLSSKTCVLIKKKECNKAAAAEAAAWNKQRQTLALCQSHWQIPEICSKIFLQQDIVILRSLQHPETLSHDDWILESRFFTKQNDSLRFYALKTRMFSHISLPLLPLLPLSSSSSAFPSYFPSSPTSHHRGE